ncbi:acyl-CoA dehydrogenase family protein [Nonomuraea rubra]|uniref:acyl-CoA dehydrogenase family protein n=1 Tax=Nonomuraea rubra TaxID=46180 RepID=UPI003605EF36
MDVHPRRHPGDRRAALPLPRHHLRRPVAVGRLRRRRPRRPRPRRGEGSGRGSITGAPRLADRPYYRAGIAEAEAALRSARAYFYEAAEEAWQALAAGGPVGDEQNAHLRLSAAHLARTAAEVVGKVVSLSGTAAIYREHPLQALLGDALVPQEHAFLSPAMYDAAGAVLMGLPPTVPAFR